MGLLDLSLPGDRDIHELSTPFQRGSHQSIVVNVGFVVVEMWLPCCPTSTFVSTFLQNWGKFFCKMFMINDLVVVENELE